MDLHHIAIKTADIFRAMAFYEHLGFTVETRFTAGITLACWLQGSLGRIELMQVPEPSGVADAFGDPSYVGYYHLSFAVANLDESLERLLAAGGHLQLAATNQEIGETLYRIAFLQDPDGLTIELLQPLGSLVTD